MGLKDLDPDNFGDSGESDRKYVRPSKEDMEEFFSSRPEKWYRDNSAGFGEIIYQTEDFAPGEAGVVLRVFTTVDRKSGEARNKGSDAIRTVAWSLSEQRPIAGRKKTLRIKTWRKNLSEKLDSMMAEGEALITFCPKCDSRMVLREGKYGEFFGCIRYPDCNGTRKTE